MSRLSRKHQAAIKKAADGQGGGKKRTVRTPAGARRYGTPVDPPIPTGAGKKTASQSPSDRSSQSATEARSSKAAKARQDRAKAAASTVDKRREELDLRRRRGPWPGMNGT